MFKNSRGVKIHQAKTKCLEKQQQRTARNSEAGEAEEVKGPESNHSAQDHQATDDGNEQRRDRINWPSNKEQEWSMLEEDLVKILDNTLAGNVKERIRSFVQVVYTVSKERYGVKERKEKRPVNNSIENRRDRERKELRKELRALSKQWKEADRSQRTAIDELRSGIRKKLCHIGRAERERKKRKKQRKAREAFTSNPFKYTADLLGKEKSGVLECPKEEVESYLQRVHNDPDRNKPLNDKIQIETPEAPNTEFDSKDITWKEVQQVVRKARAKSAPGPSGIPYLFYKKCPKVLKVLWRLLVIAWRKGIVPEAWTKAEGCFVPKEASAKAITQFRTISLLDVEGKIYFSVLAKRLTNYMTKNGYIDTSTQKGGVEGFSGCWEHNSIITQLLCDAKANKGDVSMIWLDLANAYGSVPHELVKLSLQKYHVPPKVQNIIRDYFDQLKFRFTVANYTTHWQRLEKGIITGCTISVIVFLAAINILIKTAEKECKGPKINGIQQKSLKAFMDDMTVNAAQPQGARWILKKLYELTTWARMSFKPKKCRSIVIKKGQVQKNIKFQVGAEQIPTVNEEPIKCLGKWYDGTLRDTENSRKTTHQLQDHLEKIDKAALPGRYKAWCFQHGVMPRLKWPMLMYNIPMSRVEEMERMASKHLRQWLGVPPSFSAVGLYSKSSMLQLPFSSIVEEYKVARVRGQTMLDENADDTIQQARVLLNQSGRWSVQRTVDETKSRILHKELVGTVRQGRRGLDVSDRKKWSVADTKERRKIIQSEVREIEEDQRKAKAISLSTQGAWTKWESVTPRKITWQDMFKKEPLQLGFLLRGVYDLLPTPVNLKRQF